MKGIRAGGVYLKVISKDIGDKTRRVAEVIEKEEKSAWNSILKKYVH